MSESLQQALSGLYTKLQTWLDHAVAMLPNILIAVVIVLVAAFASRRLSKLICKGLGRVVDNDALVSLLTAIARVAIVAIGLFAALSVMHLEKTVTSLLAGLGVVGLALGFAFQDVAANFMSGAFLAVRGPFSTGDTIEVGGQIGVVEEIALRHTILRTFSGLTVIMPNKEIFQNKLINYTNTPERRVEIDVGVSYGDDLRKTRKVVIQALADLEYRDQDRDVELVFMGFGESSIDFQVRFWLLHAHQSHYLDAKSEAVVRIKEAMDKAGLSIPFPIRTLELGGKPSGERLEDLRLKLAGLDEVASTGS